MYKIEPLLYENDALEPLLDTKTIDIHYNKHYKKYLENLNKLLLKNNYNFRYSIVELIDHLEMFPVKDRDDILFNIGGVLNHELYFKTLNKNGKKNPTGKLLEAINEKFNSFTSFKEEFLNSASKTVGSAYTFLVLDQNKQLLIMSTPNQETPYTYGYIPIIALDLWEHAYYLKYTFEKKKYIDIFFDILDFNVVEKIYEENI